jgi:hypothetical protein
MFNVQPQNALGAGWWFVIRGALSTLVAATPAARTFLLIAFAWRFRHFAFSLALAAARAFAAAAIEHGQHVAGFDQHAATVFGLHEHLAR